MKKFDFCIGNPPYQETKEDTSDTPVYNLFMNAVFEVADKVELVTTARFLFNAGKTPKAWNEKMLNDKHFKVFHYEENASNIFNNTEIKGGIAITYRDKNKIFGEIGVFTKYPELNSIANKVHASSGFATICSIIDQQNKFNLQALYKDHPEYKSRIGSDGKEKRFTTPIFEQLEVFTERKTDPRSICVVGLIRNVRQKKYILTKYVEESPVIDKYKAILSASGGGGTFGEPISAPILGKPGVGCTQSYITMGRFNNADEAEAAIKYTKTKFARSLLGILKVTQHAHKEVWAHVPLQNFAKDSDINWNTTIANIDKQLYKKYNLTNEEIDFIETHVKEME